MKTIWKFELQIEDEQFVNMPSGSKILSIQTQHDKIVFWAMVEPAMEITPVRFVIVGTGHPITDKCVNDGNYVGTVQTFNGDLVWHVFIDSDSIRLPYE